MPNPPSDEPVPFSRLSGLARSRCRWHAGQGLKLTTVVALFCLVHFGSRTAQLRLERGEAEDPMIRVERRIQPWTELRRFAKTHGRDAFAGPNVFAAMWKRENESKEVLIETVAQRTEPCARRGESPEVFARKLNIVDPGPDSLRRMSSDGLLDQFRLLRSFLLRIEADEESPSRWRNPATGEYCVGDDG
jgi:hypothetical protein